MEVIVQGLNKKRNEYTDGPKHVTTTRRKEGSPKFGEITLQIRQQRTLVEINTETWGPLKSPNTSALTPVFNQSQYMQSA